MSALDLPQSRVHARDIFQEKGPGYHTFEYENKESRTTYDINAKKKRRAPQPPAGSSGLGHYKPKILNMDNSGSVPVNRRPPPPPPGHPRGDAPVRPPRPSKNRSSNPTSYSANDGSAKAMVMGDKDVPIVIHTEDNDDDPDRYLSTLTLAPNDGLKSERDLGTENPLFSMQDEHGEAAHHQQQQEQQNDDAVLNVVDTDYGVVGNEEEIVMEAPEPEGVYIPAPDYEEEEKVMLFPDDDTDEDTNYSTSSNPRKQVYKEYDGEDFAQYLSDDDGKHGGSDATRTAPYTERRARTEAKRPHKKREPLPGKHKKGVVGTASSSSLRNFSFADSKFGTVNGNKKQHHVLRENTREAELFVNTGSSYERFLRGKNGEEIDYPVHDDSGYGPRQVGYSDVTPVYGHPADNRNNKDPMWKKLTWKFRKHAKNGFDVTASS